MAKRRGLARRLKRRRHYNVAEAGRAIGVAPATVRTWFKSGLSPVANVFPPIIRGVDLIDFLRERSRKRKQRCGPGRMFCLRCKAPKAPAFGEAEYWPTGPARGWLRGLCPDCATVMQRRCSPAALAGARGDLSITLKRADSRLSGTPEAR